MASDSILSAAELGIAEEERAGLIKLRDLFLSPQAPAHGSARHVSGYFSQKPSKRMLVFNMDLTALPVESDEYSCGCAACIGGHLSLMMQGVDVECGTVYLTCEQAEEAHSYVESHGFGSSSALSNLFYPRETSIDWIDIDTASAGHAIANFLATGKPFWLDALTKGGQSDLIEASEALASGSAEASNA